MVKEPKKDLEKEMFELEQELDIPSHLRWYNSKTKQETLEEAAFNFTAGKSVKEICSRMDFIRGSKFGSECLNNSFLLFMTKSIIDISFIINSTFYKWEVLNFIIFLIKFQIY